MDGSWLWILTTCCKQWAQMGWIGQNVNEIEKFGYKIMGCRSGHGPCTISIYSQNRRFHRHTSLSTSLFTSTCLFSNLLYHWKYELIMWNIKMTSNHANDFHPFLYLFSNCYVDDFSPRKFFVWYISFSVVSGACPLRIIRLGLRCSWNKPM